MYFVDARSEADDVNANDRRRPTAAKRQRREAPRGLVPGQLRSLEPVARRLPKPQAVIRHEPIDYLALRRTSSSTQALLRNRELVREILAPASPEKPVLAPPSIHDRVAALAAASFHMQDAVTPVVYAPDDDPTTVFLRDAQVARATKAVAALRVERAQLAAACVNDTQQIQSVLNDVRANISSMYMFTPSFRIWTRTKTQSALERWVAYTAWRRAEAEQLLQLTHFAVPIQRAFRARRQALRGRVDRRALRAAQWWAAVTIQAWLRRHIARTEAQRRRESQVAVALQAGWRGRDGRRRVRHLLREKLRALLRHLSPLGTLHRLAYIYHGEMRKVVAQFLSLAEDTRVDMDPMLATTPLMPVTIRRLHDAVYELQALVVSRQAEIVQAQRHYALQRALRLTRVRANDAAHKSTLLNEAMARHFRAQERLLMYKEEMEAKERRRAEQHAAGTALHRELLRERRAEDESCLAMHIQEMETRHYIAEERWRSADKRRRLGERDKVEAWQRMQDDAAAARAQVLANELVAHQAIVHAAAARERIEREQAWLAKSKEDAVMQHARMAAREAARAVEKAERKARKLQAIQAQQQRVRELATARAIKHEELATEEAARDHMLAEDMFMRRLLTEQKKRVEAQLWAAQREAAQRAKPDPLALDPADLPLRQTVERERRARLAMDAEEAAMRLVLHADAKAAYLAAARRRKRQHDADARTEARELVAMADEEALEQRRLAAVRKADAYAKTLRAMQVADEAYNKKLADRLFEARSRKLMHNEEMRLRRLLRELRIREEYHQRKERRKMQAEETHMRQHLADVEKRRLKRLEWTRRAEMCVEDVRSHQVRDLEAWGTQIGLAFWRPLEEKTLQAYVTAYPTLLRWNIQFIHLVTGVRGDPPWKNVKWTPLVAPEATHVPLTRAQEHWQRIRQKYLPRIDAARLAKQGYACLSAGDLDKAQSKLRSAYLVGYKGAQVVRAIAKCYVQLYERHYRDHDIRMGRVWYTQASKHVELSMSPSFLVEYAQALYLSGALQHAAEVLATVVSGFPTFEQLPRVIFRAAMLLLSLELYDQSKDYLVYLLEAPPPPWTDAELLFIIGRLYTLENDPRQASLAFDDAYRRWKVQWAASGRQLQFGSAKIWLTHASVWRDLASKALRHREYVLAKDLFQQTIKRRVREARNGDDDNESSSEVDAWSLDWFHLAQCHTGLCDKASAAVAVKHWLQQHPYMDQLLTKCQAWSPSHWAHIGLTLRDDYRHVHAVTDVTRFDNVTTKMPLHEKRLKQLWQRHKKVQQPKKPKRTTAELREWRAVTDPNTHRTFYVHATTLEISWDKPI